MGEEKSVKLCRANANHVETLLKVLEYDGRVEGLPVFATAMFVSPADDPDRKKAKSEKGIQTNPIQNINGTTDTGNEESETLVVIRSLPTIAVLKGNEAMARARSTAPRLTPEVQDLDQMMTLLALTVGAARSPGPAPLTPTLGPIRPSWSRWTRSKLPSIVPFDPRSIIKPPVPILLRIESWALKTWCGLGPLVFNVHKRSSVKREAR